MTKPITPSQTVGPFFSIGLEPLYRDLIYFGSMQGRPIILSGQILDGDGKPVPDALLEFWQADPNGKFPEPGQERISRGFARVPTDEEGAFRLATVEPGAFAALKENQESPHVAVFIFMRGLLKPLLTRVYFEDSVERNNSPVLKLIAPERQATLIAKKDMTSTNGYIWNINLQGSHETVFFEY